MAGHLILSLGFQDMSPSQGHVRDMSETFPTKDSITIGRPNVQCMQMVSKGVKLIHAFSMPGGWKA